MTGAAVFAGALGLAGAHGDRAGTRGLRGAPSSLASLQVSIESGRPAERFYAARAAGELGPAAVPVLLEALADPVINVRYAAAQSLGKIGGEASRSALLAVLRSRESWYVKERAYSALWRTGWRPT
jgi:HEAT repeat protein